MKFNRDKLTNISVKAAANAAMVLLNAAQDLPAEEQVAAGAAFFTLICERFDIHPADAQAYITNIMHHAEGRRPEFAAVRMYMENEI